MTSNLTAFAFIGERSEATPGLWNRAFSQLSDNIRSVGEGPFSGSTDTLSFSTNLDVTGGGHFQFLSVGSTPPSYVTTAAITIGVNSNQSDYIYLTDSSGARSNYVIGSRAGGTADGLNIWDASGATMIASFSKQSIRFYQNVVGPVFDVGGALADTLNAATFGTGVDPKEVRIQAAISAATNAVPVISRVYVPANMYPYSAGSISFDTRVQMVREGGNWTNYDVRAYGAYGDSVHTDTIAFQSAISGAAAQGGQVFIPVGNYRVGQINLAQNITMAGVNTTTNPVGSRLLWSTTGTATLNYTNPTLLTANIVLRDFLIDGTGGGSVGNGIQFYNATNVSIEHVTVANASGVGQCGIRFDFTEDSSIRDCALFGLPTGLSLVTFANNNTIDRCIFTPVATGTCIYLDSTAQQTLIQGCDLEGAGLATTTGVLIDGARGTTLIGNYLEFFTSTAITIAVNSRNNTLIGNVLHATDAATYVVHMGSAIYNTLINNEFPIGGAGCAPVGILLNRQDTGSQFLFGNRKSGAGAGTLLMLNDGTPLLGTDIISAITPVFTLTDAATIATEAIVGPAVKVTLAGNRTMGAPTFATNGQRLHFTIVQDGTGGRTLAWNAIFKVAWSDAGNTAGKRSTIAFIYDGTNWNQDGNQTPYV